MGFHGKGKTSFRPDCTRRARCLWVPHPPTVYGTDNSAPVERPSTLSEIGGSSAIFLRNLDPDLKEFPATWSAFYIDVRDCALAHVRAAFAPATAGNQRYLVAGPGIGTNRMVFLSRTYRANVRFASISSNIILIVKSRR